MSSEKDVYNQITFLGARNTNILITPHIDIKCPMQEEELSHKATGAETQDQKLQEPKTSTQMSL